MVTPRQQLQFSLRLVALGHTIFPSHHHRASGSEGRLAPSHTLYSSPSSTEVPGWPTCPRTQDQRLQACLTWCLRSMAAMPLPALLCLAQQVTHPEAFLCPDVVAQGGKPGGTEQRPVFLVWGLT